MKRVNTYRLSRREGRLHSLSWTPPAPEIAPETETTDPNTHRKELYDPAQIAHCMLGAVVYAKAHVGEREKE